MQIDTIELIAVIAGTLLMMAYGVYSRKVDMPGAVAGGIIAVVIFINTAWTGILQFLLFFLIGSLASKWQYEKKQEIGVEQQDHGTRSAVHAYSNAGAACLFSCMSLLGYNELAIIMVSGTLAAALSDTLSSEIGSIAGTRFYNIITFSEDTAGKDGVISLEGTLAGFAGALLIALVFYCFTQNIPGSIVITVAGIIANFIDSILGATLQSGNKLNNHNVNLLATTAGGIISGLLFIVTN